MLAEDRRRRHSLAPDFDPYLGNEPHLDRVAVTGPDGRTVRVPRSMTADPDYAATMPPDAWQRLRMRHDFAYWCATCVRIKPKEGYLDVPFVLNPPQLRVLATLERARLADRPISVILLKSRQWGCTTLIQHYMAWIQLMHRTGWHSVVCAHTRDAAATVRGMYDKILRNYPPEWLPEGVTPRLKPYQGATSVCELPGRDCRMTIGSIYNYDFARGSDIAMAHLTEVAFWRDTPCYSPDDLIRAVAGTVALMPCTLVAIESTANGVGNYFHKEWLRCKEGRGDKEAVFVPWYENPACRLEPPLPAELAASLTTYEQELWDLRGLSLDQIYWYRCKLREHQTHRSMMAEYPTTDVEAFTATASNVFPPEWVERLRAACRDCERGRVVHGARWIPDPRGEVERWAAPVHGADYMVTVDIGGRTDSADWSVAAVLRIDCDRPEVVAQWRGHIDHDRLADLAMCLGEYYRDALLVVESNTLESSGEGYGSYILERIGETYANVYVREGADATRETRTGFHTNRRTKELVVTALVRAVRDGEYIERDHKACDELLTYHTTPEGRYEAMRGCHDDILMTRAIAVYLAGAYKNPPHPSVQGYLGTMSW